MNLKQRLANWLSTHHLYAVLIVVLIAYIAYGLFYAPVLYSDDWSQGIGRTIFGTGRWVNLADRRPLLLAPFLLQYHLLGLNIAAYYFILWILHVILTLLLYRIIISFDFFRQYSFGLAVALLFLVFPTVYVRMWLTMLHGYAALGLALVYAYLLLRFARGGGWLYLPLALLSLIISFGLYEAQLGLAVAWAIMLILIERNQTFTRRLGLLVPLLLAGAFALWRTVGYQTVGIGDAYLEQVVTTPGAILSRLILGYRINLQWGWTTPVQNLLPGLTNTSAMLLLGACFAVLFGCVKLLIALRSDWAQVDDAEAITLDQRWHSARPYALLALAGLFLIGIGYIPVITAFMPTLFSIGSRYNMVASIGGSLFWAAVLMMVAHLLANQQRHVSLLFYAALIPLFVISIFTQISIQQHNRQAWEEQQHVWQALFKAAPYFGDGTLILIVFPGYEDRVGFQNWRRTPLYAYWDTTAALRILYGNNTLAGDVVFFDIKAEVAPTLTLVGVQNTSTGEVVPYEQTVTFFYDPHERTLSQLTSLPAELVDGAMGPVQLCKDCVVEQYQFVPLRQMLLKYSH